MKRIFILSWLFFGACSVAPKYVKPMAPIPENFGLAASEAATPVDDWRQHFKDPALVKVIEAALANNRDLKVAALRVQEYRAMYQIQNADRIPNVSGNGTLIQTKKQDPVSGNAVTANEYQASIGLMTYELDFFGRLKSLSEAALERYLATEAAARAVEISLVAETASAYIRELSLAQQEQLSLDTLRSREDTRKINESRLRNGIANLLEIKTSEMLVESSRASLAEVRREREQNRNALRVLVGNFDFTPDKSELLIENIQFQTLSPGLSSNVLMKRPDIIQAEAVLKAANANVGAARAAFFPSISMTSSIGSVSTEFNDLFKSGTEVWSFVPQINIPIFAGGRNKANLDAAKIRNEIAVIEYEQAIQKAFKEVKDFLTAHVLISEQVSAQKAVRDADAERSQLAQKRYERGVSSYLEYLDAQRSQFESDRTYLRLNELRLSNDIALYRALGGG